MTEACPEQPGKAAVRARDGAQGDENAVQVTADADGLTQGDENAVQAAARKIAAQKEPLRVVFMGTPAFAADILERLLKAPFVQVAAVYSQPDRPAGRGKKLKVPEVKNLALAHNLPVFQPVTFKSGAPGTHGGAAEGKGGASGAKGKAVETSGGATGAGGEAARAELAALAPDVLITAAYGLILPQSVLDIPRLMPINVHASLLPKYRGAAPIQRAVMAGETVTGVTVMRMEAGLDSGPILMQRAVGIGLNDTAADLHRELAAEGADLLLLSLERLSAGVLHAVAQDGARASHAPKLGKEESRLDFTLPARLIHARIRGLTPWPGAALSLERPGKEDLKLLAEPGLYPLSEKMRAAVDDFAAKEGGTPAPGSLAGLVDGALLVICGDGAYAFTRLRPAGGKSMAASAFANGYLAGTGAARFASGPGREACPA